MILADTTIWVDLLRSGDDEMTRRLEAEQILMHDFVRGEIAMGSLRDRSGFLSELSKLPRIPQVAHGMVMAMVESEKLYSRGLSYIDVHLLAAVRLAADVRLWTRDQRLAAAADSVGVSFTTDR